MEPDFKALAAQKPESWEAVCRLLGEVVFWWRADDWQGRWLAVAQVGGEPALFHGYFGSCSGCDAVEHARDSEWLDASDPGSMESVIRDVWRERTIGATEVAAKLERLGNEGHPDEESKACLAAASALGLSITLMEVEP